MTRSIHVCTPWMRPDYRTLTHRLWVRTQLTRAASSSEHHNTAVHIQRWEVSCRTAYFPGEPGVSRCRVCRQETDLRATCFLLDIPIRAANSWQNRHLRYLLVNKSCWTHHESEASGEPPQFAHLGCRPTVHTVSLCDLAQILHLVGLRQLLPSCNR